MILHQQTLSNQNIVWNGYNKIEKYNLLYSLLKHCNKPVIIIVPFWHQLIKITKYLEEHNIHLINQYNFRQSQDKKIKLLIYDRWAFQTSQEQHIFFCFHRFKINQLKFISRMSHIISLTLIGCSFKMFCGHNILFENPTMRHNLEISFFPIPHHNARLINLLTDDDCPPIDTTLQPTNTTKPIFFTIPSPVLPQYLVRFVSKILSLLKHLNTIAVIYPDDANIIFHLDPIKSHHNALCFPFSEYQAIHQKHKIRHDLIIVLFFDTIYQQFPHAISYVLSRSKQHIILGFNQIIRHNTHHDVRINTIKNILTSNYHDLPFNVLWQKSDLLKSDFLKIDSLAQNIKNIIDEPILPIVFIDSHILKAKDDISKITFSFIDTIKQHITVNFFGKKQKELYTSHRILSAHLGSAVDQYIKSCYFCHKNTTPKKQITNIKQYIVQTDQIASQCIDDWDLSAIQENINFFVRTLSDRVIFDRTVSIIGNINDRHIGIVGKMDVWDIATQTVYEIKTSKKLYLSNKWIVQISVYIMLMKKHGIDIQNGVIINVYQGIMWTLDLQHIPVIETLISELNSLWDDHTRKNFNYLLSLMRLSASQL